MRLDRTALMLGLILIGLAIGWVVGTRISGPRTASVEAYLSMVATLYSEGESLESVRERLAWLKGYDLPGDLRSLADKYERSSDPQKVRQASVLRRLGEDLATSRVVGTPRPKAPTPTAIPTFAPAPTTPLPKPTAVAATPTAPPGARRPIPALNQLPRPGVVRPEGGGSTNLRSKPATVNSPVIRIVPNESKVRILRVVDGEAVSPGEPWWYEIEFEGATGFVYYRLVEW